jgi:hypothetical protein
LILVDCAFVYRKSFSNAARVSTPPTMPVS